MGPICQVNMQTKSKHSTNAHTNAHGDDRLLSNSGDAKIVEQQQYLIIHTNTKQQDLIAKQHSGDSCYQIQTELGWNELDSKSIKQSAATTCRQKIISTE